MRSSDKRIRELYISGLEYGINQEGLSRAIEKSKLSFYEGEEAGMLSRWEFIYQQGRYIRKRFWLLQGLLLIGLWELLSSMESSLYMKRCMGIAAPLFVVMIIPELWKNRNAEAMEVECTAYYNLRQVYAARMILFGIVDLLLLSVFCVAASFTVNIGIGEFIIHFFIPFNVTCCICFGTLYSKRAVSQVLAIFLCMLWVWLWGQAVLNEKIYDVISMPIWIGMLALSVLYIVYSIVRGQKNIEKLWEAMV